MAILFEVGIACGASDFTERAIEVAEERARHNPDVAPLTGLALNMRGLFNRDSAMVAESVKVLQHSPRRVLRAIGAEGYGGMLLKAARALGISVNTVGTHLRSIYSKLAVQSRVQLANELHGRGELN